MKPVINLDELDNYQENNNGPYQEKYAPVSEKIGARNLSYSVSIVPPGKKVCPFHNHRITEEMFLVLEGRGTLRYGDKEFPIKKHDVIACPPGGWDVAHQIINTSDSDIKYFCLSTNEPFDICEYPDSNKVLSTVGPAASRTFTHISRLDMTVDYFDGEK